VFFRKGSSRREREREKSKGTLVGGENWSDRMFFHVRREKNVVLEPRHFGARMKDVIMEKIKLEVRLFMDIESLDRIGGDRGNERFVLKALLRERVG